MLGFAALCQIHCRFVLIHIHNSSHHLCVEIQLSTFKGGPNGSPPFLLDVIVLIEDRPRKGSRGRSIFESCLVAMNQLTNSKTIAVGDFQDHMCFMGLDKCVIRVVVVPPLVTLIGPIRDNQPLTLL